MIPLRISGLERLLVATVRWAVTRPRLVLLLLALVTLLFTLGLGNLRFGTDLTDWLPADNNDVQAFHRVIAEIDGVTSQELLWLELDAGKAQAAGVTSITDELAIRAQAELLDYVMVRVPEVRYAIGAPLWLELANYLSTGVAELPQAPAQFRLLWTALWRTQGDIIGALMSEDAQAALVGLIIEGNPLTGPSQDTGRRLEIAVADYRAWDGKRYDLFLDDYLTPIGLGSSLGRIDGLLRQDVLRLSPLAALLVLALLYFNFRRLRPVLVGLGALLLGLAWVYGLMGLTGVQLNLVNVALVPLLLGSGINYVIHFLNAYYGQRNQGLALQAAFEGTAARAGVALALVTATTTLGLLSLAFSNVPSIAQLGLFSAFGMVTLLLLTLLFFPAFFALWEGSRFTPPMAYSPMMRGLLSALGGRWRLLALGLVLTITLVLATQGETTYQLDVIQGNFPAQDAVAQAVLRVRGGIGGAFPEFLILEGDVTRPEVLDYTRALEQALLESGDGTRVVGLAQVLGSYEVLKDGMGQAVGRFLAAGGELSQAVPVTQEAIAVALNSMHATPVWAPLAKLLSSESLRLSVIIVMPSGGEMSLASAQELRRKLEGVVLEVGAPPEGVSTRILGYRTMTLLFIETSLYWMRVLYLASFIAACLLLYLFGRSLRVVAAVATVMLLTGLWWYGLLQLFGIYISVFLIFPLVFIVAIGSDYAIHLVWGAERTGEPEMVYGATGKSVLFSALTDAGVFFIFASSYLLSTSQVMLALALAVVSTFVCTVLVVPLFVRRVGAFDASRKG